MAREFSVIIERDADGYYVASVPALRGCHTQATSLDDLMARVREAGCWGSNHGMQPTAFGSG
jgi:predicted RNase H-like HicB family nuclease